MKKTKKQQENSQKDLEIEYLKERKKNLLAKGILKIATPVLTLMITAASFGLAVGGILKLDMVKTAKQDMLKDVSFVQMQADDLTDAGTRLENGEINSKEYQKEIEYIQSEEYADSAMEDNQDYQTLLKQEKAYEAMAAAGASIFIAAGTGELLLSQTLPRSMHEGMKHLQESQNIGNEIIGLEHKKDEDENESENEDE